AVPSGRTVFESPRAEDPPAPFSDARRLRSAEPVIANTPSVASPSTASCRVRSGEAARGDAARSSAYRAAGGAGAVAAASAGVSTGGGCGACAWAGERAVVRRMAASALRTRAPYDVG